MTRRSRTYELLARAIALLDDYPAVLALLPYAVFFPLLDSRGLYEYGDANFPLNPFWSDYVLPWSGAASAGADNTFIGVPRLLYHLAINLLIGVFHNLQVAQWLWYSSMTALGIVGAYVLARRLGAGVYSVPLAAFYALNLWSYDRVAQGPIYLSYQAAPLAIYLFLRYLRRPALAGALYFGCSLLAVIPSPQISYLAALTCAGIALRDLVLRGRRSVVPLLWLALAVACCNGFYVLSMAADALLNGGGNIALVNQRFNVGVFEHYAANVGIWNTLTLQSFYYTSIARQPAFVAFAVALFPILLGALLLVARRPALRSTFYAGLALALLGLWLVDGIVLAPGAYVWMRAAIPGLKSFVEPDYYSPLYIWGAFAMFAAMVRVGVRAYGNWLRAALWVVTAAGIVPFLPVYGDASGLPRTSQPSQYREFGRSRVQGATLWIPPDRGVRYRWSPYTINGFTSLNSPSDAIGPTMAEWVSRGTARVQDRLAQGFMNGQLRTVEGLGPLLGVGTVAIAADSLSPVGAWPNPEITGALRTLDALQAAGFVTSRREYAQDLVRLIVGTTGRYLPELGLYEAPVATRDFDDFMWRVVLSGGARYRPVVADGTPAAAGAFVAAPSPATSDRRLPASAFTHASQCGPNARTFHVPHNARSFTVRTGTSWQCFSANLGSVRDVAALQIKALASPPDVVQVRLTYRNGPMPGASIDPTAGASEVPFGSTSAIAVVRVPPEAGVTLRGLDVRWAPAGARVAAAPPPPPCAVRDVVGNERNPMYYTLSATLRGRCTLVFRQSFAPVWTLYASGARVVAHVQVDGFANGWIVEGAGPATFAIVDRALFAYAAGMASTLACVLLAIGLAMWNWRRAAARGTRRVPSPA